MNTGQVLLIISALTLLSIVTLSVNTMLLSKTTTILQSEAHLTAISIAQSMVDEIMIARFDTATIGRRVYPGQEGTLTPPGSLGPEIGEAAAVSLPEPPDTSVGYKSAIRYNDIDDYNNYKRYYYSYSLGTFGVVDSVFYVIVSSPDERSTVQTFFKRIVVSVRHPNLLQPEMMSSYKPFEGNFYVQLSDIAVYRRYF